ncbi:hypothetical protein LZ31DRAFT_137401 [Colletotrichum somersetense]|nr:hypothetical protein LZ31DRAFT_137401 [Colletotrichum somersetense]
MSCSEKERVACFLFFCFLGGAGSGHNQVHSLLPHVIPWAPQDGRSSGQKNPATAKNAGAITGSGFGLFRLLATVRAGLATAKLLWRSVRMQG